MIPPSGYLRRVIITLAVLAIIPMVGLVLTYDVFKINWASGMEDQIAIAAQQGPRKWAPAESVRFDGPSLPKDGKPPINPVPADSVSLQRGRQLFATTCAPCHGSAGQGDGSVTKFWKADAKPPANLTDQLMKDQSDGALYLTISQGYGAMAPLNENLDVRSRWDIVNYVRGLSN
jgi:S-disulfanyl-L-cysteine oxidoreductase SoxD